MLDLLSLIGTILGQRNQQAQLSQQASQFAASQEAANRDRAERVREFDTQLKQQTDLSAAERGQKLDEFNRQLALEQQKFTGGQALSREELAQQAAQANAARAQQSGQFGVTSDLEKQRLAQQGSQFGVTSDLERQRLVQQGSQFAKTLEQQQQENRIKALLGAMGGTVMGSPQRTDILSMLGVLKPSSVGAGFGIHPSAQWNSTVVPGYPYSIPGGSSYRG